MNKQLFTWAGLAIAVVLFFALNIAANASLRGVRADLTEDKVFTLEEGSKAITKRLDEPINLYFYFSRNLARDYPQAIEYADRVQNTLKEYERASGGNIKLSIIDPEPFSEAEDQAVEQGVQGVTLPNGEVLYFGLVGSGATDTRESIPFFALDEEKQRTLEYDLSKMIWALAHPDKKKAGILSALPLEGGGGNPMFGQQGEPRWGFLDQLGDFFDVQVLPESSELDKIDVLIVIHPRGFGDDVMYKIDQWALAGKPLIVFVDPQCDVDPGQSDDPTNPMSRFTAKKDSDLPPLFKAWGFELVDNKVACDRRLGVRQAVRGRDGRGQTEIPLVFLMQFGPDDMSREDPVTRLLGLGLKVVMTTPGSLRKLADGTTSFTPIIQTSEEAQEVDASQFQFMADPQAMLASFVPGYERLTLGARVTGNVKSAYPDGKPGEAKPETPEDGETPDAEKKDESAPGLKESSAPLNLLVFSDADMLNDRWWMREIGRVGSQMLVQSVSENLDLLKNAVESATGGEELMGIRMRGKTARPFERVQEIQRASDQAYLQRQKDLERKLQDAEQRLTELQKAKSDGGSEELVTAAQREEEAKVRDELVQTRRDLRDVKHQLRKDIEGLGRSLKLLNIALMPALVTAAAVALGAWRMQQRKQN